MYLSTPPSWPEVPNLIFFKGFFFFLMKSFGKLRLLIRIQELTIQLAVGHRIQRSSKLEGRIMSQEERWNNMRSFNSQEIFERERNY